MSITSNRNDLSIVLCQLLLLLVAVAGDCNSDVYQIQNVGSKKCLALQKHTSGSSGKTVLRVSMETCDSSLDEQKWSQTDSDFLVRSSLDSTQCLSVSSASAPIGVKSCDSLDPKKSSFEKYSDGTIRNTNHEHHCWDQKGKLVTVSKCAKGSNLQQWTTIVCSAAQQSRAQPENIAKDLEQQPGFFTRMMNRMFDPSAIERKVHDLGTVGIVYFGLVYVGVEILCVPAVPLTVTAGYLFGPWVGFLVVIISAGLAAAITFNLGRFLLRGWVTRKLENFPKIKKLDKAMSKEGFRVIFLIQTSPIFPFALANYIYGTTSIRFHEFWLGTICGFSPGSFFLVYSGAVGKDLLSDPAKMAWPWYVYIIIILIIAAFLHLLASTASRILRDMTEAEDSDEESEEAELQKELQDDATTNALEDEDDLNKKDDGELKNPPSPAT